MGNEREQMTTEEIGKLILENYETVAERATRFRAAHPEGVLLPLLATPPELQREEASFVAISYHNQKEYEEACQRILDAYNANPDHWPASALFTEMLAVAMLRPKGWGHAYEAPGLSYVSKTAWTENGETSAMGRCLNLTGRGEGEENYFGNMKASREEMRKARKTNGQGDATKTIPVFVLADAIEWDHDADPDSRRLGVMLYRCGHQVEKKEAKGGKTFLWVTLPRNVAEAADRVVGELKNNGTPSPDDMVLMQAFRTNVEGMFAQYQADQQDKAEEESQDPDDDGAGGTTEPQADLPAGMEEDQNLDETDGFGENGDQASGGEDAPAAEEEPPPPPPDPFADWSPAEIEPAPIELLNEVVYGDLEKNEVSAWQTAIKHLDENPVKTQAWFLPLCRHVLAEAGGKDLKSAKQMNRGQALKMLTYLREKKNQDLADFLAARTNQEDPELGV